MPIVIPRDLPAFANLREENIFVMDRDRATTQDIRPIEIAILNLMPTKETTETQLLRLLGNSSLQVNVTFIKTDSYTSTHVSGEHMERFYKNLGEVKGMKFDGMIVTGAPVETIPFEDVKYWNELTTILDFAKKSVTSTIYICWGAQAALYHMYGVNKIPLAKKCFGVFKAHAVVRNDMLLKGMDDEFYIPNSRHTAVDEQALRKQKDVQILAEYDDGSVAIAKSADNRSFFFTGHSEYDRYTLKNEYIRDLQKGLDIDAPKDYFINGDTNRVAMKWTSTANLLFYNWLNYYVYQVTPYNL